MDIKEKARFDALMSLARFRSDIREKRRAIEWKVSLGLWAFIAAAVAYLKPQSTKLLIVAWVILVVTHAWFWVRTNYNSSERDATFMHYYAEHAERLLFDNVPASKERSELKKMSLGAFLRHQPIWFEILATVLLGFAVIVASR